MMGLKTATAIVAGYLSYHMLHTQEGRDLAKAGLKIALNKSGAIEKALARILTPRSTPTPEEDKTS